MTPGRPPRGRVLVLALAAVLALMGAAFWHAIAGARRPAGERDEGPALGARDAGGAPRAAAPGPTPSAAAGGTAGGAPAGAPAAIATAPAAASDAGPPAPRSPAAAAAPAAPLDEAQLMARLRAIEDQDPAAAAALAREGNRRFPDSADAPERTSILIHALVAEDKGSEARGEAEHMVNHYPDSDWVREIERFTGAHRHRNVSVNDAGQLIFR